MLYLMSVNTKCLSSLSATGNNINFALGEGIHCDSLHSGFGWFFQDLLLLSGEASSGKLRLGQYILPLQFPPRHCYWRSALHQSTPNKKKKDFYACSKSHLFLPASKLWGLAWCCWPAPQPVIPAYSLHIDLPSFLWTDKSVHNTSSLWRVHREQ